MNHLEKARQVLRIEMEELDRLQQALTPVFTEVVHSIIAATDEGGKVVVVGVGKSSNIGHKIAATLTSTGTPSVVLDTVNALHGDLGIVTSRDIVLALSYSGETEELCNLLPHLVRRARAIVAITGRPDSSLGKTARFVLPVPIEREACPMGLAPTSSTTVMMALGDALAMVLLEARGFKEEDFADLHPGGQLGRILLTKVADIMRPVEKMACLAGENSVQKALEEMTAHRCGAAAILSASGKLEGIFTHGDFVRAYQSDPSVGTQPVSSWMTRDPITIRADKLAAEVLPLLEKHRIDDLVVLDERGNPVGLVDSQDLSRWKMF